MTVRVMFEFVDSNLLRLFCGVPADQCRPVLTLQGLTFYRARSTDRWVLYRQAIDGGGGAFDPAQA